MFLSPAVGAPAVRFVAAMGGEFAAPTDVLREPVPEPARGQTKPPEPDPDPWASLVEDDSPIPGVSPMPEDEPLSALPPE
jgi:hypothetical protein